MASLNGRGMGLVPGERWLAAGLCVSLAIGACAGTSHGTAVAGEGGAPRAAPAPSAVGEARGGAGSAPAPSGEPGGSPVRPAPAASGEAGSLPLEPSRPAGDVAALLFPDRETVRYDEFLVELRAVARELEGAPLVREGYAAFLGEFSLTEADVSLQSYARVRLVFEAARDGGLWGIRWEITNRMPWSDAIWEQWNGWSERDLARAQELPDGGMTGPRPLEPPAPGRGDAAEAMVAGSLETPSAIAECDELSALFAFLVRDLGVEGQVGLFWPTWNHTIAVWLVERKAREGVPPAKVPVVVPTSQIWLSRSATLGTTEFPVKRAVYPYQRADRRPDTTLPVTLARELLRRARTLGSYDAETLSARRNARGGS